MGRSKHFSPFDIEMMKDDAEMMAEMNTPTHLLCNQMGHGKIQVTQQYYIAVSKSGIDILQQNLNRL